jgi:hypothetical protein
MDKIINLLINNWTKGVDTYTHNGSTWLIFTEQRSWVIELTECKTLWYNYNFFKELFSLTSMDVVDNQHYITKWVEDNIIGGVKYTSVLTNVDFGELEEAIQNGVKRTQDNPFSMITNVENTIQNGVKETQFNSYENKSWVEGVIKGGVKHTEYGDWLDGDERLDEIVENGVKETIECDWNIPKYVINEVIIEGVKETNHVDVMKFFDNKMEDTLKNGVRHTLNTEYMPTSMVEDIIQNGVKETKTPGKDGDILSTIEWMEENKSTSYTKMIDDVIDNGEKINGTYVGGKRQKENIESVIGYGTKNPSV